MRRFSYRTVTVPLAAGDPYQRPDVMAVVSELREGERIVSVYSAAGTYDANIRATVRLEALLEKEETDTYGGLSSFSSGSLKGRF